MEEEEERTNVGGAQSECRTIGKRASAVPVSTERGLVEAEISALSHLPTPLTRRPCSRVLRN